MSCHHRLRPTRHQRFSAHHSCLGIPDVRQSWLSLECEPYRIVLGNREGMINPDELRKTIAKRRAEQSVRERKSPPDGVRIGPLVSAVMDGARWRGQNAFPSSQLWSDEVEKVFAFAVAHGQFGTYLPRLRGRWKEFGSALAELRVAFYLDRNQFRVAGWEPVGARGVRGEGEFLVTGPSGISTFVEVKSPGWEGELSQEERISGRKD